MAILFPFVFISFCVQVMALGYIKNCFLRWSPIVVMELLLIIGMVKHRSDPPSFDILGWEIYLWLMGSVLSGGVLAWGAYTLYKRKNR